MSICLYCGKNIPKGGSYCKPHREHSPKRKALKKRAFGRYAKAHPDKIRLWNRVADHNRYTKYKHLGTLKVSVVQQVYEDNIKKYGTLTCYLCLKPIEFGNDHIEHKIPKSRGGTHDKDNLDIACATCNIDKGTKTAYEYKF